MADTNEMWPQVGAILGNRPSGLSGGGVGTLASYMRGVKGGSMSVVLVAPGDSTTEMGDSGAVRANERPLATAWTASCQAVINAYVGAQMFDCPISYNGSFTLACPPMTKGAGTTLANPASGTTGSRGLEISAGGEVASIFYPHGLNHCAISIFVGAGTFGSFSASVYTGDVTGAIPTVGTATNRVADVAIDANLFQSDFARNDWTHDKIAKDSTSTAFGEVNNMLILVGENFDGGVTAKTGCTVVVYKGNASSAYHRIIGKIGGATFQSKYALVANEGAYGRPRDYYFDTTGSPSSTYFGSTVGSHRWGTNVKRWLKSLQPTKFGNANTPGDYGGQKVGADKIIVLYGLHTNAGAVVSTWAYGAGNPSAGEITTYVASIVALANDLGSNGIFVFLETAPMCNVTPYNTLMVAIEAALAPLTNAVFISYPAYLASIYGISTVDMRVRTKYESIVTPLVADAVDASDFHSGPIVNAKFGTYVGQCLTYQG